MKLYWEMWARCLKHRVFWTGIALLLLTTILNAFIPEEAIPQEFVKVFRLTTLLLLFGGIILGNLGFVKPLPGTLDSRVLESLAISSFGGLGGGFFVNSLFAEIFGYSLKTQEATYSWMIIGISAIVIGSFIMFGRFKERLHALPVEAQAIDVAMERNLTKGPKLGVLGWGLAGGFIMGKIPGSTYGSIGIALLFLGVLKHLGDTGVLPLILVFLTVAVLLIYSGYNLYSRAYDRETEEFKEKEKGV